ncbi:MAG: ankyrin repeat domain-containing protein [Amoebophilaceae bacterium]|nr:ankyrin repeat domain-containing protein [Amoebophilaceae bacterium]
MMRLFFILMLLCCPLGKVSAEWNNLKAVNNAGIDVETAKDMLLKYSLKQKEADQEAMQRYGYCGAYVGYPWVSLKEATLDLLIAKLLIAKGANVNHFDDKYTMAARAVMHNKPRLFSLLLENKLNTSLVVNPLVNPKLFNRLALGRVFLNRENTLLHIAALYGADLQMVEKIIESGVDVNAKDGYGSTALHYAAHYNNIPMLTCLLARGALLLKNKQGQTPINFRVKGPTVSNETTYYICGYDAAKFLKNYQKAQKKLIRENKKNKNKNGGKIS